MTSIVIPVFNQLHYTKQCLESLRRSLNGKVEIVVVDNGSTDGTAEFLAQQSNLHVLRNDTNRGCAAAWNQGVRALNAEWTVVLNNDVLLGACWLEGLLGFAEANRVDIVTPAIREGELNYNFEAYAADFVHRMAQAARFGVANGICFAVQRAVFESIGFFDENFRIGQFEDTDFFLRGRKAGLRLATTGASFIHHFGSVTQDAIRNSKTVRPYEAENRAYFRQKWNLRGPRRFLLRLRTKSAQRVACLCERMKYGHSLHERFVGDRLRYF